MSSAVFSVAAAMARGEEGLGLDARGDWARVRGRDGSGLDALVWDAEAEPWFLVASAVG